MILLAFYPPHINNIFLEGEVKRGNNTKKMRVEELVFKKGKIERIGSKRDGMWVVIK